MNKITRKNIPLILLFKYLEISLFLAFNNNEKAIAINIKDMTSNQV